MIQPLYDRVVVEISQPEKVTASGIVLPDTAQAEKSNTATVIAVGNGKVLENGQVLPVAVTVGDQIIFSKYSGVEVEYEGKEYLVLNEKDIVAIIK